MSNAPSWDEIYGGKMQLDLPPVPRNVTPIVDEPRCPGDCSGRHGVDALIECAKCGPVYRDWWHEYRVNRGVNFHQIEPLRGAGPFRGAYSTCPLCQGALTK